MGLRFRKSINLGGGFRINLSKSGIGYSWGFPGYRITKTATGNTRKTYSLPGTGIGYVEEQSNKNNYNEKINYDSSTKLITGETKIFQSTNISNFNEEDNEEILKQINKVKNIDLLSNILIFSILLCPYLPLFALTFILGIVLKILIKTRWVIDLTYEFDDFSKKKYDSLNEFLKKISENKVIWQVKSQTKVYNSKYNAGAGNNILRKKVAIKSQMPWYIKKNVEVFCLNLTDEKICFTPDRILIFKHGGKVGARTYRNITAGFSTTNFVESEIVPRDAQIVRYTWRYTNRNGDPDKRFSNNRRIPVCEYGEITLQSDDGIDIMLECSNASLMYDIQEKFTEFMNFHNQQIKLEARGSSIIPEEYPSNKDFDKFVEPLYDDIVEFIVRNGKVSASLLQRRFGFEYKRAANCIDLLEKNGIIGPSNGTLPREVLVKLEEVK